MTIEKSWIESALSLLDGVTHLTHCKRERCRSAIAASGVGTDLAADYISVAVAAPVSRLPIWLYSEIGGIQKRRDGNGEEEVVEMEVDGG